MGWWLRSWMQFISLILVLYLMLQNALTWLIPMNQMYYVFIGKILVLCTYANRIMKKRFWLVVVVFGVICALEGGGWVVGNKSQLVIITVVPFCRLVFFQSSLKIHLNFERIYIERANSMWWIWYLYANEIHICI